MDYITLRFLAAFLAGVILSQTGTFIQLSTRNVLASPSTLGFDGLAVLWILVIHSITLGLGIEAPLPVLLSGVIVFTGLGLLFSHFFLKHKKVERLILIGLTFNLLVGAVFSLWQFLFLAFNLPFPVELWFGHFRYADLSTLLLLGATEFIILVGWIFFKGQLTLFSLGTSVSKNLKLNEKNLFRFLFVSLSLGTFVVIHLFGAFSFLGLLFPIIARKMWFRNYDLTGEVILGALVNGFFLMVVDGICYFFPVLGAEIPVGLIATVMGAVSLIAILWKSDNRLEILAKT